jgi:hypothetical protein
MVSNSKIHDLGQDGVVISGGDRINLISSGNVINNNYIYNFQANLLNGAAIDVTGVGVLISHNTIAYGSGTGIVLRGNDHIIEKNEISQVCTQAGDCGAIYSSKDWTYRGNIIRYNYIHDSYGYILNVDTLDVDRNIIQYKYDSARGIYLDDGVSGFTVLGNLVVNAGLIGIQIGGGRDHIIDNNFIKTNKKSIYIDSRSPFYDWSLNRATLTTMPINSTIWKTKYPKLAQPMVNDTWPMGNKLTRNVTISTAYLGYSFRFQLPSTGNTILNNLVWHASSDIRADYNILDTNDVKGGALWGDWVSKGIDIGSVKADPCINITGKKISLTCTNSPTIPLGIKGIPADIGAVL